MQDRFANNKLLTARLVFTLAAPEFGKAGNIVAKGFDIFEPFFGQVVCVPGNS